MTRISLSKLIFCATIIWFCSVSSVFASIITLNIEWDGSAFNNNATATGFFTFDDSLVPQQGVQDLLPLPNPAVLDLGISITGSSAGNGTFGLSDFGFFYFQAIGPLDFSQELIGQTMSNGCIFGTSVGPCGNGAGGDFNLFGSSLNAPFGVWYFELETAGGDSMLVTSMRVQSVPEPSMIALLGFGLIGVGFIRKRL